MSFFWHWLEFNQGSEAVFRALPQVSAALWSADAFLEMTRVRFLTALHVQKFQDSLIAGEPTLDAEGQKQQQQ